MPKEEDLNNGSHHFSVDTVEDEYLRKATTGTDLVSFVFGLKVTWDLTQKQLELDTERELDDTKKRDESLAESKARLASKGGKKKKKKKGVEAAAVATVPDNEEGDDDKGNRAMHDDSCFVEEEFSSSSGPNRVSTETTASAQDKKPASKPKKKKGRPHRGKS